jgi:hypothetical protein
VAPEYLMKEIKKVHQFLFQCQQSMPGSNKRVFDVVSKESEYVSRKKRLFRKLLKQVGSTPAL